MGLSNVMSHTLKNTLSSITSLVWLNIVFAIISTTTNIITSLLHVLELKSVCKSKSYDAKGVFVPFFKRAFFCVWHGKQMIILFKTGFLQCCKVFKVIFLCYEIPRKKYHDNIRCLLQGKQPQYRLNVTHKFVCDIIELVQNIPLARQTGKDTL